MTVFIMLLKICSVLCMWTWLEIIEGAKFKIKHNCNLKFNTNVVFKLEKFPVHPQDGWKCWHCKKWANVQYTRQDVLGRHNMSVFLRVQLVEESQHLTSDWWLRQLRNEIVHHYNSSYVIGLWFLLTGAQQNHSPVREKTHPARTENNRLDL